MVADSMLVSSVSVIRVSVSAIAIAPPPAVKLVSYPGSVALLLSSPSRSRVGGVFEATDTVAVATLLRMNGSRSSLILSIPKSLPVPLVDVLRS